VRYSRVSTSVFCTPFVYLALDTSWIVGKARNLFASAGEGSGAIGDSFFGGFKEQDSVLGDHAIE
jgi:hypothetical protein